MTMTVETEGLPTHSAGYEPPANVDAVAVGEAFLASLANAMTHSNIEAFAALFLPGGYWRDILAFTMDLRSFHDTTRIAKAATAVLPKSGAKGFSLAATAPELATPYPDLSFVVVHFDFDTARGPAYGLARLVYHQGEWKAYTLYTALTGIHGHPLNIAERRPRGKHNDKLSYDAARALELEYTDREPDVLIIGAGHNGLATAAYMRAFGLDALVIDRNERIGDNWRKRYSSLSLHDPVWTNHLPFMPFPPTWPTFTPAGMLANWLEYYAGAMQLNVWMRSATDPERTRWNPETKKWDVTIVREVDGRAEARAFSVSHVVLATGLSGGAPRIPPPFKGQETWEGKIVHSTEHPGGQGWEGKKVLVVGSATSAHDIAMDLANNGAQTTMLQRSPTFVMSIENGTPVMQAGLFNDKTDLAVADHTARSLPIGVVKLLHQRSTAWLSQADAELLSGLKQAGFRTWAGPDASGFIMLVFEKAGGYYFDTGASRMIVDGKIKVKQGEIVSFDAGKRVMFTDGLTGEYDLVIFATGYGGYEDTVRATLGDAVRTLKPIFGLDAEGELQGVGRDCGIPHVYVMVGNLASSRTTTKNIVLQVLAERDGVLGERYPLEQGGA